jgi:ribosomal protein L11 methyltransferase
VRAHFHPPFQHIQYDIEITPKMSFGTGHHATTQLMLQYMCETDFEKKTVFDFGSGTGVLAIFASMKGAESVVAIDNDAWSVLNAIENCERNNCTNIRVSADEIDVISGTFDIILANINLNILIQYKGQIKHLLKPNGKLFLSGLLTSDKTNILSHYQEMGFELLSAKQQKEWIALEMTLTQ